MRRPNRVFIYAWDGADPQYIAKFLGKDLLPNLRRLKANFFSEILYSVKPAISPAAWSSFFTGINPGKHGVFGWKSFDIKTGEGDLNDFSCIHGQTIPEVLNSRGLRTTVIGFPLMYPVLRVNGFWIPSFLFTPNKNKREDDLVHPRNILDDLRNNAKIEIKSEPPSFNSEHGSFAQYVDKCIEVGRNNVRAAIHLYKKYDVECTLVCNRETDTINHEAKDFVDVERVYREADRDLGYVLENLDSHTALLLVSDHGSVRYNRAFYINNLLHEKGFIRVYDQIPESLDDEERRRIVDKYGVVAGFLWRLVPRRIKSLTQGMKFNAGNIDFSNTLAYNPEGRGQIYLKNNSQDIRKEVIKLLRSIEIVQEVSANEEVYSGPYADKGPGILFNLSDPSSYVLEPFDDSQYHRKIPWSGGHTETGIIVTNVPESKIRAKARYSILDMMPTILSLFGIAVPTIVDGETILRVEVQHESVDEEAYLAPRQSTDYDTRAIEKRLQALGYL